jgi:hypothetical protein
MNIPLNGRIAIVDDKYKEVEPLIKILSKKRIPFNYYTGLKVSDLPQHPDNNPVTIIFLDLNIVEAQHTAKSVISTLNPILKSLCPPKSKPYFLIIWSKKINDFADALDKHFIVNPDLKNRKPLKTIRLDKSDYFNLENGEYLFDESKFQVLIDNLKASIDNNSVLNNFFTWENIVHHETMQTINEFSSFFEINNEWEVNTKALIFHLAKAVLGSEAMVAASDETKMFGAFKAINSFLGENIQRSSQRNTLGNSTDIKDDKFNGKNDGRLKNGLKGKINSKLHVIDERFDINSFEQGNVYKLRNESNLIKRILDKENYDKIKTNDILASKPALIQLDLTPVCDYSQDKKYTRLLYGLLIDGGFYEMKAKSGYYLQTPLFHISGKEIFLLLDFRFLSTMTKFEIRKRKAIPIFRLRKEICTDIQSQLANQINRPGFSVL